MTADDLWNEISRLNNELTTAQRELVKSNARLAWLNDQKNQLLGMAAHDLRSPLSTMLTYLDYVVGTAHMGEEQQLMLERVRANAHFMLEMVDDVLDLAAIETGSVNLHPVAFGLNDLVREIEETARPMAATKRVSLSVCLAEPPPTVTADRAKIFQSVQNLVSNALKFSEPATTVVVSTASDGVHASIEVRDQGPGIPQQELEHLFEPFSRLSPRATGGEKSSGLGLAIVKRLVDAHGGKVHVSSAVGKGTSFRIALPLLR